MWSPDRSPAARPDGSFLLAWRRSSPRAEGFALLALTVRDICVRQGIAPVA